MNDKFETVQSKINKILKSTASRELLELNALLFDLEINDGKILKIIEDMSKNSINLSKEEKYIESDISEKIRIIIIFPNRLIKAFFKLIWSDYPQFDIIGEPEDGLEGLKLASKLNPDIIFTELGVSNMSGIEVTRKIKEIYPNVKIIVYTTHSLESEIEESFRAGVNIYNFTGIPPEFLLLQFAYVKADGYWLYPRLRTETIVSIIPKINLKKVQSTPDENEIAKRIKRVSSILKDLNYEKSQEIIEYIENAPRVLSEAELVIRKNILKGKTFDEISSDLNLDEDIIKSHAFNIMEKLATNLPNI